MRGQSGRALIGLSLRTLALLAGQLAVAPLLPIIVEDFQISTSGAGFSLTVMWACAALAMYPGGEWSDRLSRRTVLVVPLMISTAGLLFISIATVFPLFVLALAVLGVGIGLYEPTTMATVSDCFNTSRGRAYGVISASYSIGSGSAQSEVMS